MSLYRCSMVLLTVSLCTVLCAGCRTRGAQGGRGGGGEGLSPVEVLEGDYPLESWQNPGRRISEVSFRDVMFGFDSSQISRSERHKIEEAALYLNRHSRCRIVLEGHCDERGSREYNMSLGERRALATRSYLIGLNIKSSRIMTKSFGEEKPVDLRHSEDAWRANRRVEFAVYR